MPTRPLARTALPSATSLLAALLLCTLPAHAQTSGKPASAAEEGFSAGISVKSGTTFEKLGLPGYPGATPHADPGEDGQKSGASIGVNFGVFGVQVNTLKLRSSDSVEAVAAWYREQLPRLGPVLDCSANGPADPAPLPDKQADKQVLRCGSDRAKPGAALFKLGQRAQQRIVAIEKLAAGGTRLTLVRVDTRGVD
ncbi:hypothetical protein [Rubrivivax rivuli]|uniref:Uncharacterized protein n=1 Tax=Rubrivivax rivuli TaxID=1862385 RepID=A0A437REJ8_9BURK|nr:hypothetical protein [Rubrivivax rivuli]RVU45190.1 hypothetical protein EOE66_13650 [Rubrivivax rivuli]